jgi:outer membrane protein
VSRKYCILAFLTAGLLRAEIHPLTLKQALDQASRQNPDIALARLDEQRAIQNVRVLRDPFVPKVYAGSGLAYTYGYPSAIGGNPPSIVDLRTDMSIYNRPKSYALAAARENARGVQIDVQAKADEVAYNTASLYLDAQQSAKEVAAINNQMPALKSVVEAMDARVNEGSELPVEVKRARINLAQAQQRLQSFQEDQDYSETLLAVTLGYPATDRVRTVESDQNFDLDGLTNEEHSVDMALRNSKEIRRMESAVLAKELEIRSYKAARLPQVDLVAQYALFAKYAYQSYFQKFQRNNAQIGASFVVPLLIGSASAGQYQEAATDMAKLRIQINQTRNRITTDTRRSYQEMRKAEASRDLARQQLDLAHDDLSVLLARYSEGRVPLSDVERARTAENERWLAMYEAETQVERARLGVLRQVGNLMAALGAGSETGAQRPQETVRP